MAKTLFRDALIFDGWSDELRDGCDLLVVDGMIHEISDGSLPATGDIEIVNCAGKVLMPGLIDAHVHSYAAHVSLPKVVRWPATYTSHYAANFLRGCLDHGFTTVRDMGGGDVGLASALRDGLIQGPRFFYGGRKLSQTGGHGDMRPGDSELHDNDFCACSCHGDTFSVIADGADAVRRAIREELRRGASHIKIMASGGVSSPTDALDKCQYSDEEILAAVDETARAGKYVGAHCHPDESIRRSVELGIRSIEHGTFITDETAALVAAKGAYVVPTMAIIFGLLEEGRKLGFPEVSMQKLESVKDNALFGLVTMKRAGVKMGFGTDLLGALNSRQNSEFALRSRVLPPIDILRSVCTVNAALLREERLGCIREGAFADLLLIDGNPLTDIALMAAGGRHMPVIMAAGRFHKRDL
jgi:imidazolonepropionase-like amidohydrolase